MGILILFTIIGVVIAQSNRNRRRAIAYSAAKNRLARRATEDIKSGREPQPFAIYLRPFFSDGNINRQIGFGPTPGDAELVDLQSVLTDAMVSTFPLDALSRSQDRVSAGLIDVGEDQWWDTARERITHAQIVFLVPSSTRGTLDELQFVLTGRCLNKTLFVMPWSPRTSEKASAPWRRQWATARDACARLGLALPDYSPLGGLFRLGEDGRVAAFKHFTTHETVEVSKIVNEVLYRGGVLFKGWT